MNKKDDRSLNSRALGVVQKVNNALLPQKGNLERERDARLLKVAAALLEFQSLKTAEKWLLKKNRKCGNLPPVDLVGSEYGTKQLMRVIDFFKKTKFKRGNRVVQVGTGVTGTVRRQSIDGYVSITLDDGSPYELCASSLKKID